MYSLGRGKQEGKELLTLGKGKEREKINRLDKIIRKDNFFM